MNGYGYCHCGCGELTTISPSTDERHGYVAGVPRKWKRGHGTGKPQTWVETDCDYKTPCHIWQGGRSGLYGWARSRPGQPATFAHLMAWRDINGLVPNGHHLHHLCGQPLCVRVDHLEVKTKAEHARGHRPGSGRISKLSSEDIDEIRSSDLSLRDIGAIYGISRSHASRLRRGGVATRLSDTSNKTIDPILTPYRKHGGRDSRFTERDIASMKGLMPSEIMAVWGVSRTHAGRLKGMAQQVRGIPLEGVNLQRLLEFRALPKKGGRVSRLSIEQILDIQAGGMTLKEAGKKHGISKAYASFVRRGMIGKRA